MSFDPDVYARQGMGRPLGMGQRPALLIVDFTTGFSEPGKLGGGHIGAALERTVGLLAACRERGLPIAHTRMAFAADGSEHNLTCAKVPGLAALSDDNPDSHIVAALAPAPGELVVRKHTASAFFATDCASWLARRRVDTVLIAGCATSGGVRASAVDAQALGVRPIVVADCVGDRTPAVHQQSLFDLDQVSADVMTRAAVVAALDAAAGRPAGSRRGAG